MTPPDPVAVALTATAPDLLAYFIRRVGADDAPDLLGDTMLVAWRRRDHLPPDPHGARLWLFGIARNVINNHTRGGRRRSALAQRARDLLASDAVSSPADVGLDVRHAVDQLTPELSELVRLVHWERFTLEEAASITGIPGSTARSRYQTARRQLRSALELDDPALPAPTP